MPRRILVAVGILAALAAALYAMRQGEDREIRKERAQARLLQFDDRAVTALVLTLRGGRDWRFERVADGWRLVSPVEDVGGREAIGELLGALRRSPVERTIEEPEPLSSYGLDPPVASLRLEGVSVPRIDLGDSDPTRFGLFARVEGRPGVLVLRLPDARALRDPNPNALRDPSTLGVVRSEIRAIEIGGPDGDLALSKREDGWWIEKPSRLPAADGQVDRLLGALEGALLRMLDDETDPADPRTGLSAGARTIKVTTPTVSRTLVLGAVDGEGRRYARRDDRPALLRLDAAPLEGAPFDARSLVEKRLTKISRYAVTRFRYEKGSSVFEGTRQGRDVWTAPGGATLEADRVYAFLVRLLEAPVTGFRPGSGGGGTLAVLDVSLDGGGKDRVVFHGDGTAAVESIPGTAFVLSGTVPDPPRP